MIKTFWWDLFYSSFLHRWGKVLSPPPPSTVGIFFYFCSAPLHFYLLIWISLCKKNHFVGKKISKILLSDVDKIFNKIESYCPLCLLSLSFPILLSLTKCSPFSLSLKEWRWFILWLSVGCEDQRLKANITFS